ncbi:hypothetical protein J2D73_20065, partial [Acetobacter sacchari]|nr:hypothetical protein [Acetobacter sacchari]
MTAPWDGRPQEPERDGWHTVVCDGDRHEKWWDAEAHYWTTAQWGDLIWTPDEAVKELWEYWGPNLTPADLAARDAATIERCAV